MTENPNPTSTSETSKNFKDRFLPRDGESKADYLSRMNKGVSTAKSNRDKVVFLACQAVAMLWNRSDFENPFTSPERQNPLRPKEVLEVAAQLMAKTIADVLPKLEELDGSQEALSGIDKDFIRETFAKQRGAIESMIGRRIDPNQLDKLLNSSSFDAAKGQAIKDATGVASNMTGSIIVEVCNDLKDPFQALMELRRAPDVKTDEEAAEVKRMLAPLRPVYEKFKDLRMQIVGNGRA